MASALCCSAGSGASTNLIVDVGQGCLLGGARGGQWLDQAAAEREAPGSRKYRLFGPAGPLGSAQGGAPTEIGPPCDEELNVPMSGVPEKAGQCVALDASWEIVPRPTTVTSPSSKVYTKAVREILSSKGLAEAPIEITQILRADLEGDGKDEVFIAAARHQAHEDGPGPSAKAGDYSFIAMRSLVDGKVETRLLESEFHVEDGEFNAPDVYSLAALIDANGDGTLEVVVRGRYYEGEWSKLYALTNGKLGVALQCGCGS